MKNRDVQEDPVHQLAARLANTGQVLSAWAEALHGSSEIARRRLMRAARALDEVVGILSVSDEEFVNLEAKANAGEMTFAAKAVAEGDTYATRRKGQGLGLRGHSDMISLVEYVAFLSSLGKDGVLQAQSQQEDFILELRGSRVVYATVSPKSRALKLGDILVRQGAISPDALRRGTASARKDEFLGEALVRQRLVSREALITALTRQALMVFGRIHQAGCGFNFQFEEGARIIEATDIQLGVSHLLLESARQLDEDRRDGTAPPAETLDETRKKAAARKNARAPRPTASRVAVSRKTASVSASGDADPESAAATESDDGSDATDGLERFRAELESAVEREEVELPVLPDATGQLLAMCWSDSYDSEQLVTWVQRDQALCAHVLRIANSAAYAPVSPIYSAQIAIARLGLDKLREITMALTLKQKVFQLPGWENVIRSLWHDAAVTSGFGSALGKSCGAGGVRGGMVGLLLDIGKPIILNTLYDIEAQIGVELTPEIAEELMEEYHGKIGQLLAKAWSLPDWVAGVMAHHHDYSKAEEHRMETMVGHLACELTRWAGAMEEVDAESIRSLPVCEELGIDEGDLTSILESADKILEIAGIYS